jgi:hypothetical protein
MRINALLAGMFATASLVAAPAAPTHATPIALPQEVPATASAPDFDGDGKADLAVSVDTNEQSGSITVFYGSGSTATEVGVGQSLARDLNGDAYTDLVVGDAGGRIGVLYGSPSGLDSTAMHSFGASAIGADYFLTDLALVDSPTPRLVLAANKPDQKGKLVVYPLGSDGLPNAAPTVLRPGSGKVPSLGTKGAYLRSLATAGSRLFVGAPFATVSGHSSAGGVVVLTFGMSGATSGKLITQNSSAVTGAPAKNDYFGYSVAARDGYLAVGARGDSVSGTRSGSVQVFRLTSTKVVPVSRLTQATSGVPGKAERGDLFGHEVEVGAVCDGRPAVVVGGPGEVVAAGHEGDGSVWIIPMKRTSACPARQLWEGHGLPGTPTYFRFLGLELAVLRDASAKADQVAITGYGSFSEGPVGVLTVWSPDTLTSRLRIEGHYSNPAGR